jgi:hypothetical protein
MHRDINAIVEQCGLNGFGEDTKTAHRGKCRRLIAVTVCFDENQFHRSRGDQRAKPIRDEVRLPQGERARPRSQSEWFHSFGA